MCLENDPSYWSKKAYADQEEEDRRDLRFIHLKLYGDDHECEECREPSSLFERYVCPDNHHLTEDRVVRVVFEESKKISLVCCNCGESLYLDE